MKTEPMCPLHREGKCEEIERLHKRIAELEMQVVSMEYRDDIITQSRVFRIKFSEMLDPNEAMNIFVRNVERIFKKQAGDPAYSNNTGGNTNERVYRNQDRKGGACAADG